MMQKMMVIHQMVNMMMKNKKMMQKMMLNKKMKMKQELMTHQTNLTMKIQHRLLLALK